MLEAGLGVMAACLPVQYGLFRSEKVQSMIRSIHSLTSLGSRGSGSGSGGSGNRSGGGGNSNNSRTRSFYMAQSRGHSQSQNLNTTGGSQTQVSDAGGGEEPPLPTSGIRASSDAGSHLETQGIVVSKSFGTEEHAVQHV